MGKQSQRHIRDLIFSTVADAELSGRVQECCFVKETSTYYEFVNSLPVAIDHKRILATINNGFSRWRAISGKYAFDFHYVKHTIPSEDILYLSRYTQYTIRDSFTVGAESVVTIEDEAELLIL